MNLTRFYPRLIERILQDEDFRRLLRRDSFQATEDHVSSLEQKLEKLIHEILSRAVAFAQFRTNQTKKIVPPLIPADIENAWQSILQDDSLP